MFLGFRDQAFFGTFWALGFRDLRAYKWDPDIDLAARNVKAPQAETVGDVSVSGIEYQ